MTTKSLLKMMKNALYSMLNALVFFFEIFIFLPDFLVM